MGCKWSEISGRLRLADHLNRAPSSPSLSWLPLARVLSCRIVRIQLEPQFMLSPFLVASFLLVFVLLFRLQFQLASCIQIVATIKKATIRARYWMNRGTSGRLLATRSAPLLFGSTEPEEPQITHSCIRFTTNRLSDANLQLKCCCRCRWW